MKYSLNSNLVTTTSSFGIDRRIMLQFSSTSRKIDGLEKSTQSTLGHKTYRPHWHELTALYIKNFGKVSVEFLTCALYENSKFYRWDKILDILKIFWNRSIYKWKNFKKPPQLNWSMMLVKQFLIRNKNFKFFIIPQW